MERSQIPNYVMNTLCRICAEKSSKLISVFETESLPIKMCKCLHIQVNESDYLPLKICDSCYFKINESYTLYIKAHETDQRLKKLWKILIKETEYSEDVVSVEKTVAVTSNHKPSITIQEDVQNVSSSSNLVINIPDKVSCHSVEIPGGDSLLMGGLTSDVMVVGRAISLEVINESLILKNCKKTNDESQIEESQTKKSYETERKSSGNEQFVPETKKLYRCHFCPYQTSLLTTFSVHESTHSEERPYLCDTCGKSFKHAKYLRSHSRTHIRGQEAIRKKHICNICSKGFLKNFFLQEHMNMHTGETPYKCQVCEKEFREKVHLRQHKWTHSELKFACPMCDSKFNRKGNMTEHIKQFHKNGATVKSKISRKKLKDSSVTENKNFKCPTCNVEFLSHLLLNDHLKIHSEQKRIACTICGKKFRHSGSLTYHRRTAHTGERPFQCGYCDQKFSLRSLQTIHERQYHTFEHPFKCAFCSRSFTNSSSLRNHLYVHARDKMFKCEECGKKFARRSNLLIHKKLHSGDRKFSCDQCGKNYIQKHDLLKHKKVHDPKTKPFYCKYCGNSFSRKKDSAKHAMCQFDFLRKNSSVIYTAEKFLDSVTSSLKKDDREFSVEEEQQLILDSVDNISRDKAGIIYGDARELNDALGRESNIISHAVEHLKATDNYLT